VHVRTLALAHDDTMIRDSRLPLPCVSISTFRTTCMTHGPMPLSLRPPFAIPYHTVMASRNEFNVSDHWASSSSSSSSSSRHAYTYTYLVYITHTIPLQPTLRTRTRTYHHHQSHLPYLLYPLPLSCPVLSCPPPPCDHRMITVWCSGVVRCGCNKSFSSNTVL